MCEILVQKESNFLKEDQPVSGSRQVEMVTTRKQVYKIAKTHSFYRSFNKDAKNRIDEELGITPDGEICITPERVLNAIDKLRSEFIKETSNPGYRY